VGAPGLAQRSVRLQEVRPLGVLDLDYHEAAGGTECLVEVREHFRNRTGMGRVPDAVEDSREIRTYLLDVALEFRVCEGRAPSIVAEMIKFAIAAPGFAALVYHIAIRSASVIFKESMRRYLRAAARPHCARRNSY